MALDTHHVPINGAFLVVANHYERPGLWAGWGAMVINAIVREAGGGPKDLHWLIASELVDLRLGLFRVPRRWLRLGLARFAGTYQFGLVSPREAGVVGGSVGLRAAARYLAAGEPVGVLPEGTASRSLCEARPGVGAALAWLARDDVPIVPVGISEDEGVLTARFGQPFHLERLAGNRRANDRKLCEAVMARIAQLLPAHLHGYYAASGSGHRR